MSRPTRSRAALAAAAVLAASLLIGALSSPSASGADPVGSARDRLRADSDAALTTVRADDGLLTYAGASAGTEIDNPAVDPNTAVARAAAAHLGRYGAAFGLTRPGSTLVAASTRRAVSGQDVVRYAQQVGGVPVLGGEVVVALRADRQLGSMQSSTSRVASVLPATIDEGTAADRARSLVARGRDGAALEVTREGRWLLDPAVLGGGSELGVRTAYRFEVADGAGVRRMVLIDDRTGVVLGDVDLIQHADRVVCDSNNVRVAVESACTTGFARTETGAPSAVADVEQAFELSGAVSDFYAAIGGPDLTALLGVDVAGVKRLASTVRFCYTGSANACPYDNAFWNGTQMYYGAGFASADDVVGHEMTHGVIEHRSALFYWGQSGAINESLADIMGEILDHRHPSAGDAPTDWRLGEDLPIGAIRDLSDPTLYDQPDATTSPAYYDDEPNDYLDSGGVHVNSGVGNKTAYLISQGGTFNGQTVTGIDGADPSLTKTAVLYLDVIEKLSSGSEYDDLARVLDQSCQDLVGTHGFTAANCADVHRAGLATALATTPPAVPQPADAPDDTCATGYQKVVLLDGEESAGQFGYGATWGYGRRPGWGANATSGQDSWFSRSPATTTTSTLSLPPVDLPAGQQSYLRFQQWYLLDSQVDGGGVRRYYDGGTVEVGGSAPAAADWVNGPSALLQSPNAGRRAFSGDSRGWWASRLDLSGRAGSTVDLDFTMRTDPSDEWIGWWLDDLEVYTCERVVLRSVRAPSISGTTRMGGTLVASPGVWTPSAGVSFSYRWLRAGRVVPGATGPRYVLTPADVLKSLQVEVTARRANTVPGTERSEFSAQIGRGTLTAGRARIVGRARVGTKLRVSTGTWGPGKVGFRYQWLRNGKKIKAASRPKYTLTSADVGKRISVTLVGTKNGYRDRPVTSRPTARVKR